MSVRSRVVEGGLRGGGRNRQVSGRARGVDPARPDPACPVGPAPSPPPTSEPPTAVLAGTSSPSPHRCHPTPLTHPASHTRPGPQTWAGHPSLPFSCLSLNEKVPPRGFLQEPGARLGVSHQDPKYSKLIISPQRTRPGRGEGLPPELLRDQLAQMSPSPPLVPGVHSRRGALEAHTPNRGEMISGEDLRLLPSPLALSAPSPSALCFQDRTGDGGEEKSRDPLGRGEVGDTGMAPSGSHWPARSMQAAPQPVMGTD